MKVILQDDVVDLGRAGDLVEVKAGYGRNYLIPKGLAVMATPGNMRAIEHQRRLLSAQQDKHLRRSTHLAADINTISATFVRKAGEDDKLFGSVTSKDIADFFAEEKMDVER